MRRLQMELEKKPHEICAQNELQDLRYKLEAFQHQDTIRKNDALRNGR